MPTMSEASPTIQSYVEMAFHYLQDGRVGLIGIWGMGGVGKTSLLRRINNHPYIAAAGFDFIIWVVASQDLNLDRIQKEMAKRLGLSLEADATEEAQSESIYKFLKSKKFLLLLDDIWEHFDLAKLGIPCPTSSNDDDDVPIRKVVFTTRSEAVYDRMMACQKFQVGGEKIKVECLKREEAWQLFLDNVGETARKIISSDERVGSRARRVADKCGGLPLALIVIAHAMASNKTWHEWEDAIHSLGKIEIQEMWSKGTDPFPLLKVSYDRLANDGMRKCFLCCALWPEDFQISKDELIQCWIGLEFINNFDKIGTAYSRGHTIIKRLKQAGLLEEEDGLVGYFSYVKMHDIIRGMALWIASDYKTNQDRWMVLSGTTSKRAPEDVTKWREAEMISLMSNSFMSNLIETLPQHPKCPNLSSMVIRYSASLCALPDCFFQNMPALTYLDLSFCYMIHELPSSIGCLVGLRHLNLSHTGFTALPMELSNLTELKHLILNGIRNLRNIPGGLISKLVKLEMLNLDLDCFDGYDGWGTEGEASLEELGCSMVGLKALGIYLTTLESVEQVSKNPRISLWSLSLAHLVGVRTLSLSQTILQNGNTRHSLRKLLIYRCKDVEEILMTSQYEEQLESSVEVLTLWRLARLHKITWAGTVPGVLFRNITELQISSCLKLENVTWILQLKYLEIFELYGCEEMQRVIDDAEDGSDGGNEEEKVYVFSYLRSLQLTDLPRLCSFANRKIDFCSLKCLKIYSCPLLDRAPFANLNVERRD